MIVSGDSEATTRRLSRRAGFDEYQAEVLPEGKVQFVETMRERGATVAMVGDGLNDAPALAGADLGIAVSSGTDLAMRAASIVLMGADLSRIPYVQDLSAKVSFLINLS